jgi:excinuclease ABC subunit B
MKRAMSETARRRELQKEYNLVHGITPATINRAISGSLLAAANADYVTVPILKSGEASDKPEKLLEELRSEMLLLAEQLEFEEAARVRDRIRRLEQGQDPAAAATTAAAAPAKRASRGRRARR